MALNAYRYRFYGGDSGAEQAFLLQMYAAGYTAASVFEATDQVLTGKGTKLLDAVGTTTTVQNTTTRTAFITETIGGSTNPVAAGDAYILAAWGDQQNTGGSVTYTIDFQLGSTTAIATSGLAYTTTSGGQKRKWWLEAQFIMPTLTSQSWGTTLLTSVMSTTNWPAGTGSTATGVASSTEDFSATNASKTLTCNVAMNSATTQTDWRCTGYTLIRVR